MTTNKPKPASLEELTALERQLRGKHVEESAEIEVVRGHHDDLGRVVIVRDEISGFWMGDRPQLRCH
jgi:hypothetical protein